MVCRVRIQYLTQTLLAHIERIFLSNCFQFSHLIDTSLLTECSTYSVAHLIHDGDTDFFFPIFCSLRAQNVPTIINYKMHDCAVIIIITQNYISCERAHKFVKCDLYRLDKGRLDDDIRCGCAYILFRRETPCNWWRNIFFARFFDVELNISRSGNWYKRVASSSLTFLHLLYLIHERTSSLNGFRFIYQVPTAWNVRWRNLRSPLRNKPNLIRCDVFHANENKYSWPQSWTQQLLRFVDFVYLPRKTNSVRRKWGYWNLWVSSWTLSN